MNRMPLKEYLRKTQLLGILLCATVPVIFVLTGEKAPALHLWAWIFPAAYFAFAMACLLIPGKMRLACGIALCGAMLAGAGLLCPPGCLVVALLCAALYGGLLLWSLRIAAWSSTEEIPGMWVATGGVLHLAGLIVLLSDSKSAAPDLQATRFWLHLSLYAFILLTMFSLNRRSLVTASGKRQRASRAMRWQNAGLTGALFGLCVLGGLAPSVLRWIKAALAWLWSWIDLLLQRFAEGETTGEVAGAPGQGGPMFMEAAGEPSPVSRILEMALLIIGTVLIVGFFGFLLFRFGRMIWRFLRKMLSAMNHFAATSSEDYEDEITDTRAAHSQTQSRKTPSRLRRQQILALTPAGRIRYYYGRLSRRNPQWGRASTARENLPEEPASLYERARYSGHAITSAEAERFTDLTRKL